MKNKDFGIFFQSYKTYKLPIKRMLLRYVMFHGYYNSFYNEVIRPKVWRMLGAKVGENVLIGHLVYIDMGCIRYVSIGDNVVISDRCVLLCHRRNISECFFIGMIPSNCPSTEKNIIIENKAQIGIGAIIMPGVTIGEGGIVAGGAVVSKNVEPWTIVAGNPARVIRHIPNRTN